MLSIPTAARSELLKLIAEAVAKYKAMTPEEREAMHDTQRKNYVRAEMSWPRDCPLR